MTTILTLGCTMLLVHKALFLLLKVSLSPPHTIGAYIKGQLLLPLYDSMLWTCALPTLLCFWTICYTSDIVQHLRAVVSVFVISDALVACLIIFFPETFLQAMQTTFITTITGWPSCCSSSIYQYSSVHYHEINSTTSHALLIPINDSYRLHVILHQVPLGPLKW